MKLITQIIAIIAVIWVLTFTFERPSPHTTLYFTASWCGPCQIVKPNIEVLIKRGHDIRVVDIDENQKLSRYWRVTSVPTFVVLKEEDGKFKEVRRASGVLSVKGLEGLIK